MNAATIAIRQIMTTHSPPPPLFDDNFHPPDADTVHAYAIDTLFDPSYHTTDTEEIETKEALLAPDREKFIAAIRLEVDSLLNVTKTLIPIQRDATGNFPTNTLNKRVWKIRTTLKCKRKKRANGEPDKHKARAAARGDTLRRAMDKAKISPPPTYSPTIMPLTFSFILQLSIIHGYTMATMDIKSAYLNAPLPPDSDWIITTLEPHIALACNLDPAQEYRIANALYGLPDSGRIFYQHYRSALIAEGYTMSAFDNCLFYRAKPTETIYILVYVDDTFIFASHPDHLHALIAAIGKHYEVTLDLDATSFLGLQLTHNLDSTVTLTQPKLLQKLFALYPPRAQRNNSRVPYHPYAPEPKDSDPAPQPIDTYAYLRLLGILLYLTKSRPDIMATVSFAGTKSSKPTDRDFSDLNYVVEYLRHTESLGQIFHRKAPQPLQLYCEVDASYLTHPDS
jgi:hypothetical protein